MVDTVGTLGIEVKAEINELIKKLQTASKSLEEFGKNAEQGGKKASDGLLGAITVGNLLSSAIQKLSSETVEFVRSSVGMFLQYETSMYVLQRRVGIFADEMVASLKEAAHGNLNTLEAVQETNRALAFGLKSSQIPELMEIAVAKSREMGIGTVEAYENIIQAIGRMRPMMLLSTGILIDEQKAFQEVADALNVNVAALDDNTKRQIIFQAVTNASRESLEKFGGEADLTVESVQSLGKAFDNLKLEVGELFAHAIGPAIIGLDELLRKFLIAKEMAEKSKEPFFIVNFKKAMLEAGETDPFKFWDVYAKRQIESTAEYQNAVVDQQIKDMQVSADARQIIIDKFNVYLGRLGEARGLENELSTAQKIAALTLEEYSAKKARLNDLYKDPALREAIQLEKDHKKALAETNDSFNSRIELMRQLEAKWRGEKFTGSKQFEAGIPWAVLNPETGKWGDVTPSTSASTPIVIENNLHIDGRQIYEGTQTVYEEENLRRGGT